MQNICYHVATYLAYSDTSNCISLEYSKIGLSQLGISLMLSDLVCYSINYVN